MSFSFVPPTGLNDTTHFPAKDPLIREHIQKLLQQIPEYYDLLIALTNPEPNKLFPLGSNGRIVFKTIAYQNKQTSTGTSNVFGIPIVNLPQSSMITVIARTEDNLHMIHATFLVKNFGGIVVELIGSKIKSGIITDVVLAGNIDNLFINVLSSGTLTVNCSTSIIQIGGEV